MTVLKKSVSLNPSESKVVTFTFAPQEVRTYQVTVDGLVGSFAALGAPPPGEITYIGGLPTTLVLGEGVPYMDVYDEWVERGFDYPDAAFNLTFYINPTPTTVCYDFGVIIGYRGPGAGAFVGYRPREGEPTPFLSAGTYTMTFIPRMTEANERRFQEGTYKAKINVFRTWIYDPVRWRWEWSMIIEGWEIGEVEVYR